MCLGRNDLPDGKVGESSRMSADMMEATVDTAQMTPMEGYVAPAAVSTATLLEVQRRSTG